MTMQPIEVPDLRRYPIDDDASAMIDAANEAIERFMLRDTSVIENFVTCDFHLVEQSLAWIDEYHLSTGNRFCELGAGFAVAAILAARRGYDAVAIEIEPTLVEQADQLATELESTVTILGGSFVPRSVAAVQRLATEVQNVDTTEDDALSDIDRSLADFDLFFAFPWPGEHGFFETIVDTCGCTGAMLLTYRGREGMFLSRKVA